LIVSLVPLNHRIPKRTGTTIAYLRTAIEMGGRLVARSLPTGHANPHKNIVSTN